MRDLRLSVIDRCNFRCTYCMPAEEVGADFPWLEKSEQLSFDEMIRLVHQFSKLGVEKIRLTISLDALSKKVFREMNGGFDCPNQVLEGLYAAKDAGFQGMETA